MMNNGFNELGISTPILKAIEEMGFETPTEVQSRAIPHILNKEDLIVTSKTGSGKTAVFGVSMLDMIDPEAAGPQGLVLTPTRELAVQIENDIKKLAKHLQHKTTAVYGQHSMNVEIQSFKKGVSIVIGTPGRLFDHISHGNLVTKHIRFLILDEADRMLDMGFIDQVVRIIRTLPKDRITLLFSATIPDEIKRICSDYMKNPVTIEIESPTMTVDTIRQVYYRVERNEKRTQLNRLLMAERPKSCMIFCNTKIAVDQVQSFLTRKGYASQALHGDIPQGKRLKTIEQFKQGEFHILVATDVAARGIHIDNLSLVINYDVPVERDSYVHRIGRTGRAGNGGLAITLATGDDIMSLYEIEEHIGAMISEAELPQESILIENKAEIDQWIQDNAIKAMAPQNSGASGQRINRTSHSIGVPAPQNGRQQKAASAPDSDRTRSKQHGTTSHKNRPIQSDESQVGRRNKPVRTNTDVPHTKETQSRSQYTGKPDTKIPRPEVYQDRNNSRSYGRNNARSYDNERYKDSRTAPVSQRTRDLDTDHVNRNAAHLKQGKTNTTQNMSDARQNKESLNNKETAANKPIPLLKRLLQRIFGK